MKWSPAIVCVHFDELPTFIWHDRRLLGWFCWNLLPVYVQSLICTCWCRTYLDWMDNFEVISISSRGFSKSWVHFSSLIYFWCRLKKINAHEIPIVLQYLTPAQFFICRTGNNIGEWFTQELYWYMYSFLNNEIFNDGSHFIPVTSPPAIHPIIEGRSV
jgi:hypothetical protein